MKRKELDGIAAGLLAVSRAELLPCQEEALLSLLDDKELLQDMAAVFQSVLDVSYRPPLGLAWGMLCVERALEPHTGTPGEPDM